MIGKRRIETDVEGSDRGLILRYNPGICLKKLRKTTKTHSQNSLCPSRGMYPGHSEYEAGVRTAPVQQLDPGLRKGNAEIVH
jgi:hypothetical protein